MKRIITVLSFALAATVAGAQTMTDALLFGTNSYYGTARSMALGNAMTAVGGDLGSIGINPAGSAVAPYSQFVITPGVSIAKVGSAFSQSSFSDMNPATGRYEADGVFGDRAGSSLARMTLPNIGLTVSYPTGNYSGVTSVTFGTLVNTTSHFTNRISASGRNAVSSMLGAFAAQAQGNADGFGARLDPGVFDQNTYDPYYDPYKSVGFNDYYWNWNALAGYNAYMFGDDEGTGMYSAATQDISRGTSVFDYPLAGVLGQKTSFTEYGTKADIILNAGIDINDRVYVGFNIGFPVVTYRAVESFEETAEVPELFPTGFRSATYDYVYDADISGVYAKLGVIVLPTDHLRIGAAIQTPSSLTVNERYTIAASTVIGNRKASASDVPTGYNDYSLRTPYIVNAGIAYTFAERALVSIDYEMADYSVMKFGCMYYDPEYDTYVKDNSNNYYFVANTLNKLFCGPSHAVRAGLEYRLDPVFSVRCGYNFVTSPVRYYRDEDNYLVDADFYNANFDFYYNHEEGSAFISKSHVKSPVQSFSLGFGYSSAGSFFADAALKMTEYPEAFYSPYSAYVQGDGGKTVASALVKHTRTLFDAALTVGWRF